MSEAPDQRSAIDELAVRLGAHWPSIQSARAATLDRRAALNKSFSKIGSTDTTLVVFGSVARQEVTSGSDLDWILLVDGQTFPEHKNQERDIEKGLNESGFAKPGASGIFGRMVGSHDLVHNIGGEDDLNSNVTRRVLLLLESYPVGNREAYDRVRLQILRRYLLDDRGLTHSSSDIRIPRFLLNDLTRYWRTVTVDFVYKQRADNDRKWALRNAKLRMSRKLIYAAGLAHVFFCHLDEAAKPARSRLKDSKDVTLLTKYLSQRLVDAPLETLAKACLMLEIPSVTARSIFGHYDRFLGILDDSEKRKGLEDARTHDDLRQSEAWNEVRQISGPFHEGLVNLFLRDNKYLKQLTMNYGIF